MITDREQTHRMGNTYIDDYVRHLRASKKSKRTIEERARVLRRLNDYLPFGVAFAATEQIEAFLAELEKAGRSRWTIITYRNHFAGFYHWADHAGILAGDPTLLIGRAKSPKCLPDPVTDAELAAALQSRDPWFVGVVLAAFGGYRVDEIARAHRDHITEQVTRIRGKGDRTDIIPTHPFLWDVVRDRAGPLFAPYGRQVTGRWITSNARHHFDHLGMPGVHMHRFRHWYGTMIQQGQGDIRVTQQCMRHASVTSTEGYTMVSGDAVRAAVAGLHVPGRASADQ